MPFRRNRHGHSSNQLPTPVLTDFLSASDAARLVAQVGVAQVLQVMQQTIEADYRRWQDFDKSARTAAHSAQGVIELMPVADERDYAASNTSTVTPATHCRVYPPSWLLARWLMWPLACHALWVS